LNFRIETDSLQSLNSSDIRFVQLAIRMKVKRRFLSTLLFRFETFSASRLESDVERGPPSGDRRASDWRLRSENREERSEEK
jgi:hypothetical protein